VSIRRITLANIILEEFQVVAVLINGPYTSPVSLNSNDVVVVITDPPEVVFHRIDGSITVDGSTAISVLGDNCSVSNDGVIQATDGSAIVTSAAATTFTMVNRGGIAGSLYAINLMSLSADQEVTMTNLGAIQTQGAMNDCIRSLSGGVSITNSGTIAAMGGSAIDLGSGVGHSSNRITNSGSITVSNTKAAPGLAINLAADNDTIINSGTITGSIDLGDGTNILRNTGRIIGSVISGSGMDLIDLRAVRGGTVTGGVFAGGRADTVRGSEGTDIVFGQAGDDLMRGNGGDDRLSGAFGNDTLSGGNGNDVLRGGAGADNLIGGQGADQFDFDLTAESRVDEMDRISLFARGQDDINLNTIDAKTGVALNQNFSFIGAAAFTAAGQVRIVDQGANVRVEVNTTGAKGAEMVMMVLGVGTLTATDFIL
jgi:Ca2+-binding RTX toxin-like protein